jgi:hypothetical protein
MIKKIERMVIAKRRKVLIRQLRPSVFARLAKTENHPRLYLNVHAKGKNASTAMLVIRWTPSRTSDGPFVPNREYGELLRMLENPPPYTDSMLQMMAEHKRIFNIGHTSAESEVNPPDQA